MIFGVVRSGRAALAPFAVGGDIAAGYWFTSSTSFANPAVLLVCVECRASHIVSGDQHLMELGVYGGIRILDATGFLAKDQDAGSP